MKVLLAEDEKNFGMVLKNELTDAGFDVDLAVDGVDAVLKFMDDDYGFVLLDIKMPKLDGINALRIIKKINRDVPAMTYSGNAGSGEMADSVRAGAIRCLTKPIAIATLKQEIDKYRLRREGGGR